jgi:hypothetical protein
MTRIELCISKRARLRLATLTCEPATSSMSTTDRPDLIQLSPFTARSELRVLQIPRLDPDERKRLESRAKLLAWVGNGWHVVEFAIALAAELAAASVALVGFGIDSLIELLAGGVIVWLFSGGRGASHVAERRAQLPTELIGAGGARLHIGAVGSPCASACRERRCSRRAGPRAGR